ncbi:hypothetical protein H1R20_g8507, partial [Candolleomyces eurysporus]
MAATTPTEGDIELTIVPIVDFLNYLSQNPDPYNDCDVISVTHAKNIDSPVSHEYLHLVIRHQPSNEWRRLLVERQSDRDQVIVGFWPWVQSPDDSSNAPGPSVNQPRLVGGISGSTLRETSRGILSSIFGSSSSSSSSSSSKPQAPNPLLMRNLQFVSLNLRSVASVLLELPTFRRLANEAASQFKDELKSTRYAAYVENPGETPLAGEIAVSDEVEASKKATLALEKAGAIANLDESAILRVTKERKDEINEFSKAVLDHPEKEENLKFFDSRLSGSKEAENTQDYPFINELHAKVVEIGSAEAPSKEEEARYEEAIRAFAGGVLRKVREDGVVF